MDSLGLIGVRTGPRGSVQENKEAKTDTHKRFKSMDVKPKKVLPGPGDYTLPPTFDNKMTLGNKDKQFFGSSTARFGAQLF